MNSALLGEIEKRLDVSTPGPKVVDCVLTACLVPEDLTSPGRESATKVGSAVSAPTADISPPRVFIESITVEGFRGIGPALTLNLTPGPGLTLVVGRNGSGKSSLSDAFEVLLTGSSARWAAKNKVWQEGWRNLHHPYPTRVEARLAVEGQPGFTTVARRWASGADLGTSAVTVARAGQAPATFDSLGWHEALAAYRPFLSYSELGGLLEVGATKLFDALNAILGLDDLSVATKALADARLEIEHRAKLTASELQRFRQMLEASQDDRAGRLLRLTGRVPDLDGVAAVLTADTGASTEGQVDLLRRLAAIEVPSPREVAAAAEALTSAARAADAAIATDAGRAREVAQLLDEAVAFHQHYGDGDCPVCGRSQGLSAEWRAHADAERALLRAEARVADEAHGRLTAAIANARTCLRPLPVALAAANSVGITAEPALAGWQVWAAGPVNETPDALATHLNSLTSWHHEALSVQAQAAGRLGDIVEAWRPISQAGLLWLERARADRDAAARIKDLKAAEMWLKKAGEAIRAERFAPLAARATEIWKALRQRSSVDIGGITLAGSANARKVKVDVLVDGSEGAALAVMSQGELHALALALFFPRATLAESPFRFVVIDDPVQAMDPAKVEGLARVLEHTAAGHQVVVLTHDDRLPEAVRRLRVAATIVEVDRGPGSQVLITKVLDPVDRHLRDARDVARDKQLPDAVKATVVPTLCRQALEATCVEIVRRRRLVRGDRHQDVEDAIGAANKLSKSFALALFDDVDSGGGVFPKLKEWGWQMADTYQACNKGAHGFYVGDPLALEEETRALVKKLRMVP